MGQTRYFRDLLLEIFKCFCVFFSPYPFSVFSVVVSSYPFALINCWCIWIGFEWLPKKIWAFFRCWVFSILLLPSVYLAVVWFHFGQFYGQSIQSPFWKSRIYFRWVCIRHFPAGLKRQIVPFYVVAKNLWLRLLCRIAMLGVCFLGSGQFFLEILLVCPLTCKTLSGNGSNR